MPARKEEGHCCPGGPSSRANVVVAAAVVVAGSIVSDCDGLWRVRLLLPCCRVSFSAFFSFVCLWIGSLSVLSVRVCGFQTVGGPLFLVKGIFLTQILLCGRHQSAALLARALALLSILLGPDLRTTYIGG